MGRERKTGEIERGEEEKRAHRHVGRLRTHTCCALGEKTITEGHYQMRFVKLPGISLPLPHPPLLPCSLPSFSLPLFLPSFFHYSLTLMISLGGSGPVWDGRRHTILLAINLRL